MLQTVHFLLLGLGVLLAAGEAFVRGAASLARILNIPVLIIGLTVVAFGTSAPELLIAMRQIATTGDGPRAQTASMGCSIKWRYAPHYA